MLEKNGFSRTNFPGEHGEGILVPQCITEVGKGLLVGLAQVEKVRIGRNGEGLALESEVLQVHFIMLLSVKNVSLPCRHFHPSMTWGLCLMYCANAVQKTAG